VLAEAFPDYVEATGQRCIAEGPVAFPRNGDRMVAVSDFSGLLSSPWALARAAAMAPIEGLELCMDVLFIQELKADGSGFRSLGAQPVAGGLPGVFRH
jgi:hypothetical protein